MVDDTLGARLHGHVALSLDHGEVVKHLADHVPQGRFSCLFFVL